MQDLTNITTPWGPWIAFNPGDTPPADDAIIQVQFDYNARLDVVNSAHTMAGDISWDFVGRGDIIAYRAKPQPVRGGVVFHIDDDMGVSKEGSDHDTHRLPLPTIDGALVAGEFRDDAGNMIKLEVL